MPDRNKKQVKETHGICAKCGSAIVDERPVRRRGKLYHADHAPTPEEEKQKSRSYT